MSPIVLCLLPKKTWQIKHEIIEECIKVRDKKYFKKGISIFNGQASIYSKMCALCINRILALFRKNSGKTRIYLDEEFRKDIA